MRNKNRSRYVRFCCKDSTARWGHVSNEEVYELERAPWEDYAKNGEKYPYSEVTLLPPATPSKIVALGYNYRDLLESSTGTHSSESQNSEPGEPIIFLKGPNTLSSPNSPIQVPAEFESLWVEVELAILIGTHLERTQDSALIEKAIFGHMIANDVSAANIQNRDWHLARSKSLDGFCPVGPELITGLDTEKLSLGTKVNDRQTQLGCTSNRVLNDVQSVALISKFMTLEAGDLILTGTPAGARESVIKSGDSVSLCVEGLGELTSDVI